MFKYKLVTVCLSGLLALVLFAGCDDDKGTNNDWDGPIVYAELGISRAYLSGGPGVLSLFDTASASIDSVYSPDGPVQPYPSLQIACNSHSLAWAPAEQRYVYTSGDLNGFLLAGSTYTFHIESGQGIAPLQRSIDFPVNSPVITSPIGFRGFPDGSDTVSTLFGFLVEWSGAGEGNVDLMIFNSSQDTPDSAAALVFARTANDGDHEFTPSDLASLTPHDTYKLFLVYRTTAAIIADGYEDHSLATGRIVTWSTFYVIDWF